MCRRTLLIMLAACASGSDPSAKAPSAGLPASATAVHDDSPMKDPWRGRVARAGHPDARFSFSIPAGLAPLRGVTLPADPNAQVELAHQGPDGVGLADGSSLALNSIVVFSDPAGLGVAFEPLAPDARQELAARYVAILRQGIPDAQDLRILQVGAHLALQIELPRVVMKGRPERRGRHYLVFNQSATASVDCLWTDEHATQMSAACHAVAASLERVSHAP